MSQQPAVAPPHWEQQTIQIIRRPATSWLGGIFESSVIPLEEGERKGLSTNPLQIRIKKKLWFLVISTVDTESRVAASFTRQDLLPFYSFPSRLFTSAF
jgi:hypothetical protein